MNNSFRGLKSLAVFDITNSNKIKSNTINTTNIISNNIQTTSYTSGAVNTIVTPSVVYDGIYTINPNGVDSYILNFNIIDNNLEQRHFTIDADTTLAQVNDRVVLMFKVTNAGGNTVTCNLSSDFYYTRCGEYSTSFLISGLERMVIEFFYDGEKYVNTYDNC